MYKTRKSVKQRVEDNRKNRQFGTYGNRDGLDVSHKGKRVVLEKASKNRGSKSNTAGDKRARGKKGKGTSITKREHLNIYLLDGQLGCAE